MKEDEFIKLENQLTINEMFRARQLYNMHLAYLNGDGVKRDELKAIDFCEKAAKMGIIIAQYDLASYYYNGLLSEKGICSQDKEMEMAYQWFLKTATNAPENVNSESFITKAQYNIGVFFENGNYVKQDYKEAEKWYRFAAESGLIEAQINLSIILRNHFGEKAESVYWCSMAAEQGDTQAQFNLGVAYFYGYGIDKDIDKSIYWLKLAVKNHHPRAQEILDAVEAERRGVPDTEIP